jgi:hypothetical protein
MYSSDQVMGALYPSTQRHYRRLIYYLYYYIALLVFIYLWCRSQWPCSLRHELSSPTPTLRSWVRIPLEVWMFVCVLCAFILCPPHVEVGKNIFTVIPASRKRRQKGNRISLRWDSASQPKKRLMRTYHWISLFKSYIELQQISL